MARRVFKSLVPVGWIGLLSAALLGNYLTTCRVEWLQQVAREIQAAGRDAGTQWMVMVCLLSYFVTFVFLARRWPHGGTEGTKGKSSTPHPGPLPGRGGEGLFLRGQVVNPDFWLVAFLVSVLLRYAVDYTNAAKSLQVVVLLTGIVIGKGVALWAGWSRQGEHSTFNLHPPTPKEATPSSTLNPPSSSRRLTILGTLTGLLSVAALWQPDIGMEFHYRGIRRWEGIWDNPNTYGLLMGVGLVLAMGLLVASSKFQVPGCGGAAHRFRSPVTRYLSLALLFAAASVCAFGLLKSYSRGAWLGTAMGIGYLFWKWINRAPREHSTFNSQPSTALELSRVWRISRLRAQVRLNWLPTSILLLSILVISFWQFRHTESPLLRRVFSVGNVNDFSWRNRVTAWQGAGRMMLDKPMVGFGWGKAEEVYSKEYRAERLEETAAIQLNDFLMIGISAGLPALLCWATYISLAGYQVSRIARHRFDERSTLNYRPSTIPAAGALVLLIGFWFDGGLFKLPTGVVFWVLLELARSPLPAYRPPSPHPLERRQGEGRQRIAPSCSQITLRYLAGIVAALALGQTALHLGTPQLAVGERTLSIARNWLVPAREKSDFEFLAAKPVWAGKPLKALLQHAHLANYNRELVNWKVDDSIYQQFVLSPEIDPAFDGNMNWRRPLWEHFYPRIRKEGSAEIALETVIRELRIRVKIADANSHSHTIADMWHHGEATASGFEALSVAALRSVGIPARLSAAGQVEFWNGAAWKPCMASVPPTVP